jgi:hypothetical protein
MVFITKSAARPAVGLSRPAAASGLDTIAILMIKLAPGRSKFYKLERYDKNNGPLGAVMVFRSLVYQVHFKHVIKYITWKLSSLTIHKTF